MTTQITGFVGISHLGIVTSIGWASFNRPVVAYDPDTETIKSLSKGKLPVHEPALPELFAKHRSRIQFTDTAEDLAECRLVIIAKDIPTTEENQKNLTPIYSLVEKVLPHLQEGVVLVLMSQVPPGFTRELSKRIQALRPELKFTLYYWVETLIFGRAVERTLKPERFIVGCEDPSQPLEPIFENGLQSYGCPILPMRYESAELTKTAINLYLINAVTYANTLSDLCSSIGGDWGEVVPALKLDARIGPSAYLSPSLGITGGNLERDLQTLKELCYDQGVDSSLIDTLIRFNSNRYNWVLRQLREHIFQKNSSPRLAIWGLTYKKNTHSMKNSPSVRLIQELGDRVEFQVWDPVITAQDVDLPAKIFPTQESVLKGIDGLLIMADWDQFSKCNVSLLRQSMKNPVIIDCVGILKKTSSSLEGIRYISMGCS